MSEPRNISATAGAAAVAFALISGMAAGWFVRGAADQHERAGGAHTAPVVNEFGTPFPGSMIFTPNDGKRSHPGVLVLEDDGQEALQLAAAGYAALAFRPEAKDGNGVELAKSYEALRWLAKYFRVDGRVVVVGNGHGAEHALLLTSVLAGEPDAVLPTAVVAQASTEVASGGWLWRGQQTGVEAGKRIEVERLKMPLLLLHGGDDDVAQLRHIEKALHDAGRHPEVHVWNGEGRQFSPGADGERRERLLQFLARVFAG